MNTKLNKEFTIAPGFEKLFEFDTLEDANMHHAKIIMMKFLQAMEKSMGKNKLNKKTLAGILGVSPSYVTQLYNGDKLINLEMIARIEQAFGIEFKVQAVRKTILKSSVDDGLNLIKTKENRYADIAEFAAKARKKASAVPVKMHDILNEVEKVREARYAKKATKPH
jgi:transcriptional regulator with XRE-family HTH domain